MTDDEEILCVPDVAAWQAWPNEHHERGRDEPRRRPVGAPGAQLLVEGLEQGAPAAETTRVQVRAGTQAGHGKIAMPPLTVELPSSVVPSKKLTVPTTAGLPAGMVMVAVSVVATPVL